MRQSRLLGIAKTISFIFDGENGGSKVGNWSGQRQTISSTQIKLNTIANSTSVAKAYTNSTVNVTNYHRMVFIVTKASNTTNGGYRRVGVASSSNTSPSNYATVANGISSATRYVVDLTSLTGNKYVSLWVSPKSGSNASETIVTKIWME